MKSTYKILSVNLDGLPLAKNIAVKALSSNEALLFGIDADYNLFDYPHCRRAISVSALLSDDLSMLSHNIEQLQILEELIVKIDYISPLAVTNRFFIKRILQAIGQLQKWHPEINFVLVAECNELNKIKALIRQLYLAR